MVSSKYQFKRLEIIDRELSKKSRVKTKDLQRIIENELDRKFTLKTIQNDMITLENEYSAPVKIDNNSKSYYYEDRNFTISAFGLKEEDLKILLLYRKILDQYKGQQIYENVIKAIEKVIKNFKIKQETKDIFQNKEIVQIEKVPVIRGIEYILKIISAIEKRLYLEFQYNKFDGSQKHRKVIPILLKEDKHMWYLIGKSESEILPKTFALDRIYDLRISQDIFVFEEFNADEYFKYSFGVTVPEEPPVEVILSFTPSQGNYIKTLPIHNTQKELIDNNLEYRISVMVKPSYEFYSKILSYGSDIKVVEPNSIAEKIKLLYKDALKRYK